MPVRPALRHVFVIALAALILAALLYGALPQVPSGTWSGADSMSEIRAEASAVLLPDGRVLVTGGTRSSGTLATAEVFGTNGGFSAVTPMNTARSKHVSVVLLDGRVLVAGGIVPGGGTTNAAEIYNPANNSWSSTAGSMIEARSGHTATLLKDGRVLIAGGAGNGTVSLSAEIYDPVANQFAFAGSLSSARNQHAAALLQDGRVLIIGGTDGTNSLSSTDLYDPIMGTVASGPGLSSPRAGHSATTLLNGDILVVGGSNIPAGDLASAEIYGAVAGSFAPLATGLAIPRRDHLSFLLPHNNTVLIVGGTSNGAASASAELYIPWANTFQATGASSAAHQRAIGSPLKVDGLLLLAGGEGLASSELYGFATVKTDKDDYAPGEIVTITGAGWQPGETVTLTFLESPLLDTHPPLTVVADAFGNISNSAFSPDEHDVGIRFYLTANGANSQAQTVFTDAVTLESVSVAAQAPNPIAAGFSAAYNVTLDFTGTGSSGCSATLSVLTAGGQTGLPAGTSPSFSLNPVPSTGGDGASTLTISTSTTTPPGTYTFTVQADPPVGGGEQGCTGTTKTAPVSLVVSPVGPTVQFNATSSSRLESVTPVNLAVSLSAASVATVTVNYSVLIGTATGGGVDYTLADGTLTFLPGQTTKNIPITIINDLLDEPDENIAVTLSAPSNASLGSNTMHVYTIEDNEPAPTVEFDLTSSSNDEDFSPASLEVKLSAVSGKTVTVGYMVTDGTASEPGDFSLLGTGTLTFAPGDVSKHVQLFVVDDLFHEFAETVEVTLFNPTNADLGDTTVHTYTILDDDPQPTVAFALASSSGAESSLTPNLAVQLSAASSQTVTVKYAVTGGTANDPADFSLLGSGTLTFAPGDTSKNVQLSVVNGLLNESDETVEVTLSDQVNATLGATFVHTYTIENNDPLPTVAFNLISSQGPESSTPVNLEVKLSAASGQTVTVDYAATAGTASGGGVDYTLADGTLTFNPGVTVLNVPITVTNDVLNEADETVVVTLSDPSNATLGAILVHTYTIQDDGDPAPTVSIDNVSKLEGNSGPTLFEFTVSLSAPSGQTVTVKYATADGTATDANNDYEPISPAVLLTFAPGETSKPVVVTVNGDNTFENNETFFVNLSDLTHLTAMGSDLQGIGTIENDDEPPVLSIDDVTQAEGNGGTTNFIFTVTKTGATDFNATVNFATALGVTNPATAGVACGPGVDYQSLSTTLLTFLPADLTKSITVTVCGDVLDEEDSETFVVNLSNPTGATISDDQGLGTITDDDAMPTVAFNLISSQGPESSSPANLEVKLSAASGRTVTVAYAATGGTAGNPADFTLPGGPLSFAPGITVLNIPVTVIDDGLNEAPETVIVTLSAPTNATLGAITVHTYTILDNDPEPTISINDVSESEGDSPGTTDFTFTVSLSTASGQTVSVKYATADGTATDANNDYEPISPAVLLTFAPGETSKPVVVTVNGDNTFESNETFFVNLSLPVNATISDGEGLGTILNDDATIKIDKHTVGAPTSFSYTTVGTGPGDFTAGFSRDTNPMNPTNSTVFAFGGTQTGVKEIKETALAGYVLTNIVCYGGTTSIGTGTGGGFVNNGLNTFNAGDDTVQVALAAGDVVSCTFTNTQRGTIIVEKQTIPDGAVGEFTFTGHAAGAISDGQQITVPNLAPGTYTSTEIVPSGWDLNSIVCSDANSTGNPGTGTATFNLEAGETVICTFTDRQRGTIIVDKQTIPDGAVGEFTFTGHAAGTISDGQQITVPNLAPGTYTSTEIVPSGWDLTAIVCSDGNSTGNPGTGTATINLEAGETVTCTFTDTKRARILVDKITAPGGDPTEFTFTPSGFNGNANFLLADNTAPFESMALLPGSYSVTETVPGGWDLTAIVCSDANSTGNPGTGTATINLEAGETVTCTFTDTKRARILVDKVTVPGGDPTNFTFTPSGFNGNANFLLADATAPFESMALLPGSYSVTETVPGGWDLTAIVCSDGNSTGNPGTGTATINLEAGETVTCTFTDTKRARILVDKVTAPGGDPTNFTFTPSGFNGNANFLLADNTAPFESIALLPGSYSVTETVPGGWDLTAIVCSDGNSTGNPGTGTATINLEAGETVTCTFTDTKRARILVDKVTAPGGDPTEFTFTPSGFNGNANFLLADNTAPFESIALLPGSYSVTETVPSGWDLTAIVCSDANSSGNVGAATATFNLEAGETVTCTFTDTKRARILVDKITAPGGDPTEFTFTPSGFNGNANFLLADNTAPFESMALLPGSYSVTETVPGGWDLTAIVCSDGNSTGNPGTGTATINLEAGEMVTCTFTDTKRARILVDKITAPGGDPTEFTFTPSGFNGNANFLLADNTAPFESMALLPGSYSVTETVPSGWGLTLIVCSDGNSTGNPGTGTATINLEAGETVTCTFTDTKRARILVDKVTAPGGDPTEFTFTPSGFNGNANFLLADNTAPFESMALLPGSYSVTETVPGGWDLTAIVCSDGNSTGNPGTGTATINLEAGETVTCTFTDTRKPKLTVNKFVNPTTDTGLFNLQIDDSTAGTGANQGHGGTTGPVEVAIGSHSVGETAGTGTSLSDYTTVIGGDCASNGSVTLAAGDNKTCTLTNTRKTGTIEVVKDLNPSSDPGRFNLQIDGVDQKLNAGDGDTTGAKTVNAGTHTVGETGGTVPVTSLADYTSSISCVEAAAGGTNGASPVNSSGAGPLNVPVANGDVWVCTLTNTVVQVQAQLKVTKVVVNDNGGNKIVAHFPLFVDGQPVTSGVPIFLNAGPHTVSETGAAGYLGTISGDCALNGTIMLSPGDVKNCTITNDDIAPTLIVIKHVVNNNDGTNVAGDFTITVSGTAVFGTSTSFPGAESPGTTTALKVGSYSVTENGPSGYTSSFSSHCSGSIGLGQIKTCTITNTAKKKTTIKLGNTTTGQTTDHCDSNAPMGTRYVSGSQGGTALSMSVYVASPLAGAPNNQFQLAVYADNGNNPGTLIASTASGVLTTGWNTLPITVAIAPNTAYWLFYNTNGTSCAVNNLRYTNSGGRSAWQKNVAFGAWPATVAPSGTSQVKATIYLSYVTGN